MNAPRNPQVASTRAEIHRNPIAPDLSRLFSKISENLSTVFSSSYGGCPKWVWILRGKGGGRGGKGGRKGVPIKIHGQTLQGQPGTPPPLPQRTMVLGACSLFTCKMESTISPREQEAGQVAKACRKMMEVVKATRENLQSWPKCKKRNLGSESVLLSPFGIVWL